MYVIEPHTGMVMLEKCFKVHSRGDRHNDASQTERDYVSASLDVRTALVVLVFEDVPFFLLLIVAAAVEGEEMYTAAIFWIAFVGTVIHIFRVVAGMRVSL